MGKFLIVVDMQNDFVDGALGTDEAKSIVPAVVRAIEGFGFGGKIYATLDTHKANYLSTLEGKVLPVPHCIKYTSGWALNDQVADALNKVGFRAIEKRTFGSDMLAKFIEDDEYEVGKATEIYIIGLCTDICVISNALILKAHFPETDIIVDSKCCAGVTPEKHEAALEVMRSCQIRVL